MRRLETKSIDSGADEPIELVPEVELIRLLHLDDRPNVRNQRRALDQRWKYVQDLRIATGQPPLTRIWIGRRQRYCYTVEAVLEFLKTLGRSM